MNHIVKSLGTVLLGLALVVPAMAQRDHRDNKDHRSDRDHRDWDGRGDHRTRDRDWDTKHRWHRGDRVVDYPDFRTWHLKGGFYPVDQYDQDRQSHDEWRHQRAAFFAHATLNLGGHNYIRATVTRGGHQYYSFSFGG